MGILTKTFQFRGTLSRDFPAGLDFEPIGDFTVTDQCPSETEVWVCH